MGNTLMCDSRYFSVGDKLEISCPLLSHEPTFLVKCIRKVWNKWFGSHYVITSVRPGEIDVETRHGILKRVILRLKPLTNEPKKTII